MISLMPIKEARRGVDDANQTLGIRPTVSYLSNFPSNTQSPSLSSSLNVIVHLLLQAIFLICSKLKTPSHAFSIKQQEEGNAMEGNNSSYGTSWADQWDYSDPTPVSTTQNKNTKSSTAKYKQKVGEGLGKTKAVASTGVKKVKEGTSLGIHWIKEKYHKTTQKH
ncbi:hypothetical protein SCA6_003440 [Theobroma cacao]